MPRGSPSRLTGRNFAVGEYARWLDAMSDRDYNNLRSRYNSHGGRRNMETFEDSLRSFDRELREYLQFNSAAGYMSVPGPLTIESMLSAWLGRDSRGEPTPEAVAEQRIISERAGFRPVGREGYGIRGVRPSERGGPRQRSPFDDHRGGRSSGRFGEPRQRPYREPFRDNERNRRPPFQDPRNPFVTAPRGGRSGPRGTYTSRHEPNRESHRHRQGVAPPIREPRDREYSYGPSRRLAQPPSIVGYSGDDEASTNEGWEDNLHKNLKGASIRYGEPGWGLSFDR